MVLDKHLKSQKEINKLQKGIENLDVDVGQQELDISIEFGQQKVSGVRTKVNDAVSTMKKMLEGDISFSEEGLRALVMKNSSVIESHDENVDGRTPIVHSTQPKNITVKDTETITSPKTNMEKVDFPLDVLAKGLGLKIGKDMLFRDSVIANRKAIPIKNKLGEIRRMTVEQLEKIVGRISIEEKTPLASSSEVGESTSSV